MLGKLTTHTRTADEVLTEHTRLQVVDGMGNEPISGWRAWKCVRQADGTLRLVSPSVGTVWQPGWIDAEPCMQCTGQAQADCVCGINACKRRRHLCYYAVETVVGRVELAGTVRQFQRGYRAERAKPVELHVRSGRADLAAGLAQVYGCPTTADRTWRLQSSLWLIAIAISAALGWLLTAHVIHGGVHALLTGQDSSAMRLLVDAPILLIALSMISGWISRGHTRLGALAMLCLLAACIASVTTTESTVRGNSLYNAQLNQVGRTGKTRVVHIDRANAGRLLPATNTSAGGCMIERYGHRLRVCRQGIELRITLVK